MPSTASATTTQRRHGWAERSNGGHAIWIAGVAFSPDGQRLISAGGEGVVKVWDVTGFDHAPGG
jgi:WD40 repeat protein